MATSAVPAVIDYLVTTFTASAALGGATPAVTVYDGPAVTDESSQLELFVGVDDPDAPGAPTAATATQAWVGSGTRVRDEMFDVHLTAVAWSGDTDMRTTRVAAMGIVAAVETVVRADASLGGLVLMVNPGVTGVTLRQNQVAAGVVASVSFAISCHARI